MISEYALLVSGFTAGMPQNDLLALKRCQEWKSIK